MAEAVGCAEIANAKLIGPDARIKVMRSDMSVPSGSLGDFRRMTGGPKVVFRKLDDSDWAGLDSLGFGLTPFGGQAQSAGPRQRTPRTGMGVLRECGGNPADSETYG